ncbi:hypothetical protein ACFV1C_00550 [Streptomyces sp. NPDC059605]|uniref:hypothetical protein n=1 Tax=Streptomyces sp. NPDC059605 TaxID=3346882 RepID=UPI0036BC40FB
MEDDYDQECAVRRKLFDCGRDARDVPWSEVEEHYPRIAYYDQWDGYPDGNAERKLPDAPGLFIDAVVVMADQVREGDTIIGFIGDTCRDFGAVDLEVTVVDADEGGVSASPNWVNSRMITFGLPDVEAKITDIYPEEEETDPLEHGEEEPIVIIRATQH